MKANIINDINFDEDGMGMMIIMIFYEDGRGDTLGEDLCEPGRASNDPLFDDEYSLHFQTVH